MRSNKTTKRCLAPPVVEMVEDIPENAFFIRKKAEIKLDFPAPVLPTIPIFSPILILKFRSLLMVSNFSKILKISQFFNIFSYKMKKFVNQPKYQSSISAVAEIKFFCFNIIFCKVSVTNI